jgi:AcrR family transcriptional regulator
MEIQERILYKAHEMFMKYGIRSISMDEIAGQLGVSKKTIYQYYTDKDALVEGVIGIEIRDNELKCLLHQKKSENAIQEIFLAMETVTELLKVMNPSLFKDLEKYHATAFKKLTDHKNKFLYAVTRKNLERGIAEGLYKLEINTDILARFRMATVFFVFSNDLFPATKMVHVLEEITDNFLYGVATAKGIKLIEKYKHQHNKK